MDLNQLIPADTALEIVLAKAKPGRTETRNLVDAAHHVLASDLVALRTQPPFDASAMDGYAVKNGDIDQLPAELKLVGEAKAGTPFNGTLSKGSAVRIFTGAVVPEGADTIVIQENTEATPGAVKVLQGEVKGRYIRPAGLDFRSGEILLKTGDQLTPNRIALAASMNHAQVKIFSPPHMSLIATGDELVLPGAELSPGQIIASNTYGIAAAARASGASVTDLGIAEDTRQGLESKLRQALNSGSDIIVTTGGASVGDHDLVLPVAEALGFKFEIAKIAMRPGKPFLFATCKIEDRTVFLVGLAGNPVSSLVAFNVFVKPLIGKLAGKSEKAITPLPAILGRDLPANDERMEYMRASLINTENGTRIATPFEKQDSSMLATLVRADCLLKRPANAKASPEGEACEIVMLD